MIRFINKTGIEKIDFAIADADRLLAPESKMMIDVFNKRDWKYDSGNSSVICYRLSMENQIPMLIGTYAPRYRNSKAIGSYSRGVLEYNKYMLPFLDHVELVGNLVHEWAHHCGFHHRDPGIWGKIRQNYKTENKVKYSVPYWLSENVERWL